MLLQSWAALPRTRSCARLRRARTLRRSASPVIADAVTPTARVRLTGWMLSPGTARQRLVCKYFQKGSLIAIDGRLQSRSYQDKNGNNRTATEVLASQVSFCGGKAAEKPAVRDFDQQTENHVREANTAHSAPQKSQNVPEYSQGSADDFSVIDDSEDLPF